MTRSLAALSRRSALQALARAGTACLLGPAAGVTAAARAQGVATARGSDFGIRSDGRSDDAATLQAAIDTIAKAGGGELVLSSRAATVARAAPVVADNVSLNLNGGTLLLHLSEHGATGVRLRSGATLRNGSIVVRSSGQPSLQAAAHAPVVVGPLYGEGGSPDRPSPDEGVSGWTIRDLVLSSDKDVDAGGGARIGAAAIQVMGGAHGGLIENIEVPDDARMVGGVHLDWGFVGPISSQTIPADRDVFQEGRGYTTHPHDIAIRNIRIGRLTRSRGPAGGTFGVRLSGVYDIRVSDVAISCVTEAGFLHTAGDLGFEFAPADVKRFACQGVRISDAEVADASTAYLIWTDSYADNVGRETLRGYRPILDPIHATDMIFENVRGAAGHDRQPNFGVRVNHQRGGRIVDCVARGYKRGFYIDEQVDGLALVRPVAIDSAEHGISVEHPSRPPRNVVIENPVARGNGRDPGGLLASGILIGQSEGVEVRGGEAPLDLTQRHAVRVVPEARGERVSGSLAAHVSRE